MRHCSPQDLVVLLCDEALNSPTQPQPALQHTSLDLKMSALFWPLKSWLAAGSLPLTPPHHDRETACVLSCVAPPSFNPVSTRKEIKVEAAVIPRSSTFVSSHATRRFPTLVLLHNKNTHARVGIHKTDRLFLWLSESYALNCFRSVDSGQNGRNTAQLCNGETTGKHTFVKHTVKCRVQHRSNMHNSLFRAHDKALASYHKLQRRIEFVSEALPYSPDAQRFLIV